MSVANSELTYKRTKGSWKTNPTLSRQHWQKTHFCHRSEITQCAVGAETREGRCLLQKVHILVLTFIFLHLIYPSFFHCSPKQWMEKQENTGEKSGQLLAPWRAPTNKIKKPESQLVVLTVGWIPSSLLCHSQVWRVGNFWGWTHWESFCTESKLTILSFTTFPENIHNHQHARTDFSVHWSSLPYP